MSVAAHHARPPKPNYKRALFAFFAGGAFWYGVGHAADAVFFPQSKGVVIPQHSGPSYSGPWWGYPISFPLWVGLAALVAGLLAAYWGILAWFFGVWLPYTITGLAYPKTLKAEMKQLSRVLLRLSSSKGSKPSAEESFKIAETYAHKYGAHVYSIKHRLRRVPTVTQQHPLMAEWTSIIPLTHIHVRRIGQILEELTPMVPEDIGALTRPPFGEKWQYES